MTNYKSDTPAAGVAGDTGTYRGPERRSGAASASQARTEIHYDAKGNPVLDIRADEISRRRKGDDTVDLLKCLDLGSLSLADEDDPSSATASRTGNFNPYDRGER